MTQVYGLSRIIGSSALRYGTDNTGNEMRQFPLSIPMQRDLGQTGIGSVHTHIGLVNICRIGILKSHPRILGGIR
jgi:hypothetical protein